MGLLDIFKKKKDEQEQQSIHNPVQKPEQQPVNQNSLLNDIGEMSEWVVNALNFSGYKAISDFLYRFTDSFCTWFICWRNSDQTIRRKVDN